MGHGDLDLLVRGLRCTSSARLSDGDDECVYVPPAENERPTPPPVPFPLVKRVVRWKGLRLRLW